MLTLQQLKERVSIQWIGYETYKVNVEYRGKGYSCTSHDGIAYDRIRNTDIPDNAMGYYGCTKRQALQALYDECKRANDI